MSDEKTPAETTAEDAALRRPRRREDTTGAAAEGETTADGPDMLSVLYQGPSDEFFHSRAGRMVRSGAPVRLTRAEIDDLSSRFPDHAWAEV